MQHIAPLGDAKNACWWMWLAEILFATPTEIWTERYVGLVEAVWEWGPEAGEAMLASGVLDLVCYERRERRP